MRSLYRLLGPLAALVTCSACVLAESLEEEAWAAHRAGSVGVIGRFGLWNDHSAFSHMEAETNFGPISFDVETELKGTLGLVSGVEVFVADDVSLQLGADYRRFEPEPVDNFVFEEIGVLDYFLSSRWVIPRSLFGVERLRPYVEAKLAFRPETDFDSHVELIPGLAPGLFAFRGGPSWTLGLGMGVVYQLRDNLVANLGLIYEWPLSDTQDVVPLELIPGFAPLILDSELRSEGMLALIGLTYYL